LKGESCIVDAQNERELLNAPVEEADGGPGDEIVRQRRDKLERLLTEEG